MAKASLERGMGSLQTVCEPKKGDPWPESAPEKCKSGKCDCEWEARWRELGRSRRKQFKNKAAGLKHLTTLYNRRLYAEGRIARPKGKAALFKEFAEEWLEIDKEDLAKTSRELYQVVLRRAYAHMGAVPVDKITPGSIKALVKHLETVVDKETGKQVMNQYNVWTLVKWVLPPIFRKAIKEGWINTNPCDGVKLKPIPEAERYVPEASEVFDIMLKIEEFWRAAIAAMAGAGLREGEVLGLTKDCIQGDVLYIYRQWGASEEGYSNLKHDTTRKGRRIPLDPIVKAELEAHIAKFDVADGQPIFYSSAYPDQPFTSQTMHKRIREAVLSLGLEEKGIRAHNFRHFFATKCVARGIEIAEVARMLGHADIQTTFKTYYKFKDEGGKIRMAINGFLSDGVPDNVVIMGAYTLAKADNSAEVNALIKQIEALTGQQVILQPRTQAA